MDAQSQPMNMRQMSLGQKVDLVAGLACYPALTVLIFIRRRVGFRTLRPFQLVLMFLLLSGLSSLFSKECHFTNGCFPGEEMGAGGPVYDFAYVFLIVGFLQRWLRWRQLAAGKSWHSYSRGISYFEFLSRIPVPYAPRLPLSFVYRFVDPALVACVAMAIGGLPNMNILAKWLFFSAFCLMFVESYTYDKQLDHQLDILDTMVEGEVHAQIAARYAGAPQALPQPGLSHTAGIPTGFGPDISRQIAARRSADRTPPDNLAAV